MPQYLHGYLSRIAHLEISFTHPCNVRGDAVGSTNRHDPSGSSPRRMLGTRARLEVLSFCSTW
jgi:hypothetical protein